MLSWGTILYYADRDTGDIREVVVDEIDERHFFTTADGSTEAARA